MGRRARVQVLQVDGGMADRLIGAGDERKVGKKSQW